MDLIHRGMQNINAKLSGIDDEKLVTRLVEIWNFFWVNVLPYIEGVSLSVVPAYQLLGQYIPVAGLFAITDRSSSNFS